MKRASSARPNARWIGGVAILALLAGVGLAARHGRAPVPPGRVPPPGAEGVAPDLGEAVIGRALRQAGTRAEEDRWVDDVPGADLEALDPRARETFLVLANAQRCTCGCEYTLAACRVFDPTCEESLPRVVALLDSIRAGHLVELGDLRKPPDR